MSGNLHSFIERDSVPWLFVFFKVVAMLSSSDTVVDNLPIEVSADMTTSV